MEFIEDAEGKETDRGGRRNKSIKIHNHKWRRQKRIKRQEIQKGRIGLEEWNMEK